MEIQWFPRDLNTLMEIIKNISQENFLKVKEGFSYNETKVLKANEVPFFY